MVNIPINVRRVAVMIGILVLVFIVLEFNRRLEELTMLNKQNDFIRTQATQAVQTQYVLQTAVAYANSTAAVEEWARTDGHYIKELVDRVNALSRQFAVKQIDLPQLKEKIAKVADAPFFPVWMQIIGACSP